MALDGEKIYDISRMEIKKLSWREFEKRYDNKDAIDASQVKDSVHDAMWDFVLPKYEENILVNLIEPLYQLLENYNNIFYILWSLGKRDDIENPFKAYVELWDRRLEPYIIDENLIVIVG